MGLVLTAARRLTRLTDYNTGDQVTFNGEVWESVIDANTWSPANYPAGWVKTPPVT